MYYLKYSECFSAPLFGQLYLCWQYIHADYNTRKFATRILSGASRNCLALYITSL